MKEQNKPETPKDQVLSLVRNRLIEVFGKLNNTGYTTIGIINDAIPDNWQPTQTFSHEDCEKMLEALRQRCAEEATNSRNINSFKGDIIDQIRQNVKSIDVHQFIPPLTK